MIFGLQHHTESAKDRTQGEENKVVDILEILGLKMTRYGEDQEDGDML